MARSVWKLRCSTPCTVLFAALFAAMGGGVFAETYTWVGGTDGLWASRESYSPNGTPGSGDTVEMPSGKVKLNASSAAELSAANAIGRIVPQSDSVLEVDVQSGDATASFAFTRSANDGDAVGTLRKTGAGSLTIASAQAGYVSKSMKYDYYANIEVAEGSLKLPQNATPGDQYILGVVSISNNASFFTLSTPSETLTYTHVVGLCGEGTVTNSASAGYATGQVLQPHGAIALDFSGRICSPVRWSGRGSANLTGTNNTMISTFYQAANGGRGESGVHVGIQSFGKADGSPSSIGTVDSLASRDEGAAFVYLGTGETTDKNLTVGTSITKPYPTFLSGGEYGGLIWSGLWLPTADRQMQQLVICGDGGTNIMRGAIQRRSYSGTNYTFHIRKAGSGTWRIEDGSKGTDAYYQMLGGWTVEDGTLQFTSISETNFISSLGMGLDLFKDVGGYKVEANRVSYGFTLGGDDTEGTLEYVGTADDICTERPIWLYGDGAFKNNGAAKIRFRGVSSVTPKESPSARQITFTLKGEGAGENEILDITDSIARPVSVVKEGSGKWVLGGEQSFHGTLEVKGGRLILRRPEKYTWYRWMLTSQENATSAVGFQIQEFGLFDDNGIRQNYGLTLNTNYASLQPGEVAYGTDKIAVPSTADRDIDKLFDDYKSDYGYYGEMRPPNATAGKQTAVRSDPYSWFPIVMRLTNGVPDIVAYDTIFYQVTTHARSPTSYFVDGSVDGIHWNRLSTVDSFEATGANSWYYNRGAFGAGGQRNSEHANGCPIAAAPESLPDMLNNVKAVSVAAGATLECDGDITIPNLAFDCAAGGGTFVGCAFAQTPGVIDLANAPGSGDSIDTGWTFSGCSGVENLSGWAVSEGGAMTTRRRIKVEGGNRVSIVPCGFRITIR